MKNTQRSNSITVLGIDPGSRATGWGVVREVSGVLELVDCGVCRPKSAGDFSDRLGDIYHELAAILDRIKPDESAIEQVFTAKNAASALKLGQARGVAIAACASRNIPIFDYTATEIKKTLTGTGTAEKAQVSFMVGRLLNAKPVWPVDAGDALGAAICHLTMRRLKRFVMGRHPSKIIS
jgi:crossover junction endodeoxyribonuclease RuvC